MPVILLFILAATAIFVLSQGTTGIAADACGHCASATGETGMKISYDEILKYAQDAGFGNDAPIAAAIAMAESGGDTTAYNKEPQDVPGRYGRDNEDDGLGSYGLWQIYRAAHPEASCADLTDPSVNAYFAFQVYSAARGFHPWSTFNSGAYQNYLQS